MASEFAQPPHDETIRAGLATVEAKINAWPWMSRSEACYWVDGYFSALRLLLFTAELTEEEFGERTGRLWARLGPPGSPEDYRPGFLSTEPLAADDGDEEFSWEDDDDEPFEADEEGEVDWD